jgi:hypothetical protein
MARSHSSEGEWIVEPGELADEPPPPTLPQPQGTNPPDEAELAHLAALQAEAQTEEPADDEPTDEE